MARPKRELIEKCQGCNKELKDDRWTVGINPLKWAHWDCIKAYNLKWRPYN